MAALLTSEIDDSNKRDIMKQHIDDARRLGVEVLPPDINASEANFTVVGGKILFGLLAVKGLGRAAANEIARVREEGGPYRDVFDFCERLDVKTVSAAAMEKLIKAGALDRLGRRAQLVQVLPRALQVARGLQQDRRQGQRNIFDALSDEDTQTQAVAAVEALPDVPEWPEAEKLKFEKEALDFYFSSHPLAQHEDVLRRFATHTAEALRGVPANQEVIAGGMLAEIRFMNTKRARNGNSRYARCKVIDFTGEIECVMWPDDFVRHKDDVVEDRVCFVKGTVERTREEPGLVLTRIMSLEQAQRELTRALVLTLHLGQHEPPIIDAIARVLRRSQGACPVYLAVRDAAGRRSVLRLDRSWSVNPATVATAELETLLGTGTVRFSGPSNGHRNGGG
jgi:DNA polymerase-3 subunit alpha